MIPETVPVLVTVPRTAGHRHASVEIRFVAMLPWPVSRGRCSCGWTGPWRLSRGIARSDAREHRRSLGAHSRQAP